MSHAMLFAGSLVFALFMQTADAQEPVRVEKMAFKVENAFEKGASVSGDLRIPDSKRVRVPAVVILHSTPGFNVRGAFYAEALNEFAPLCPMFFIYGRRKPLMFHARSWAEALGKREGNRVVPFDTGHWVMTSQPERFNQVVGDWLAAGK